MAEPETKGNNETGQKISAYQILHKASLAFFDADSVVVTVEHWIQEPLWHMKLKLTNFIKDVDDYKVEGRMSFSSLVPNTNFSSSSWLQSYQIGGVPFSWSSSEREWKNEALKIEEKRARKVLQYSMIQSLFSLNDQTADISTLELLGVQKKSGKDCFVIKFKINPESLKRWGMAGDLTDKVWVDSRSFLPEAARVEGKLGNMDFLEVINYKDYNAFLEFNEPDFIAQEAKDEREELRGKIKELIEETSRIRGWTGYDLSDVKIDFVKRKKLKEVLRSELTNEARLKNEEKILKWFDLIPPELDYKELIVNSEISSMAGMYDSKNKTIFIGDWLQPSLAEIVCVHEITHAFQDKILGLAKLSDEAKGFDYNFTLQALLEGEAFAVSLEYLLNKDNESIKDGKNMVSLMEAKINNSYLRDKIFYNLYGVGARFIQAYLDKNSWKDIDRLYENMPNSTREILHPNEYLVRRDIATKAVEKGNKKKNVREIPVLSGWQELYSTTLGEYFISSFLGAALDKESCGNAMRGWHSDKLKIYTNERGEEIFIFLAQWDSPQDVLEFSRFYVQWLEKKGFKFEAGGWAYLKDKKMTNFKLSDDYIMIIGSDGLGADEFNSVNKELFSEIEKNRKL